MPLIILSLFLHYHNYTVIHSLFTILIVLSHRPIIAGCIILCVTLKYVSYTSMFNVNHGII